MRPEKQNLKRQNQNNPNKSSSTDSPYSQVSMQACSRGRACAILSFGGAYVQPISVQKTEVESQGHRNKSKTHDGLPMPLFYFGGQYEPKRPKRT